VVKWYSWHSWRSSSGPTLGVGGRFWLIDPEAPMPPGRPYSRWAFPEGSAATAPLPAAISLSRSAAVLWTSTVRNPTSASYNWREPSGEIADVQPSGARTRAAEHRCGGCLRIGVVYRKVAVTRAVIYRRYREYTSHTSWSGVIGVPLTL